MIQHQKMRMFPAIVVSVLATSLLPSVQGAQKQDYYNLHSYLFSGNFYNKEVRPVDDDSEPLNISLQFELLSLVDVNEKAQTLTTTALLDMHWFDDYLAWNPDDHGGIQSLMVRQDRIWLPDIILGNGVESQGQLGYNEHPIRLESTGNIFWEPTVLLSTSCSIVITYFPFDSQECFISFETALSKTTEVMLIAETVEPFPLWEFNKDGQWKIIKTKTLLTLSTSNGKGGITYVILMSRRRTFYLLTIMLPVFFLSLTASLIFALPPDEGEKTGTGITVLLAFAVYLTIVANLVPNTSLQVSILGLYLTAVLGLTAIGLICCVFILRIHYRDSSLPIDKRTIAIVHCLRRFTRMAPVGPNPRPVVSVTPQDDKRPSIVEDLDAPKPTSRPDDSGSPPVLLEDRVTWQIVAATLDWFCYLFFTLCTIFNTLGCLLALEIGSNINSP